MRNLLLLAVLSLICAGAALAFCQAPNVQPVHMPYAVKVCSEPCSITGATTPSVVMQRGAAGIWGLPFTATFPVVSSYSPKPVTPGSNEGMARPADTFYVQQQEKMYTVTYTKTANGKMETHTVKVPPLQ